ncbi:hypothetical protein CEV31_2641 [Brucella thiophenivorans]|uniref:Uncharacterized protein n=1 Tax=Brucella thiophenivorans TaxID=571255 RepID=A0A256FM51_9HYPH|nr:hypothetical protein CEV31_2641 [Brucella thiophenivorans]
MRCGPISLLTIGNWSRLEVPIGTESFALNVPWCRAMKPHEVTSALQPTAIKASPALTKSSIKSAPP